MNNENANRLTGEPSAETLIVEKRFRALQVGEVVTYEAINKLLPGSDVQTRHRGYARTAIARCERDGVFIRCRFKEGWERVSNAKEVECSDDVIDRSRRLIGRGRRRLARVEMDSLSQDQKRKYYVNSAVMGAMVMFSKPKSVKLVEDKISESLSAIGIKETLKLFAK